MTLSPFWASVLRAAATGFIGAFVPLVSGILNAPNWDLQKSLALSALIAGLTAAARAGFAAVTKGENPFPDKGL